MGQFGLGDALFVDNSAATQNQLTLRAVSISTTPFLFLQVTESLLSLSNHEIQINNKFIPFLPFFIIRYQKNEHDHVFSFFVRLCVDIANIDMHAINDEDQENDPEIHGNSYAIEFVLEALVNMMTIRSAVIRSYSCDLIGKLLVDIPQEYELTLPVIEYFSQN